MPELLLELNDLINSVLERYEKNENGNHTSSFLAFNYLISRTGAQNLIDLNEFDNNIPVYIDPGFKGFFY